MHKLLPHRHGTAVGGCLRGNTVQLHRGLGSAQAAAASPQQSGARLCGALLARENSATGPGDVSAPAAAARHCAAARMCGRGLLHRTAAARMCGRGLLHRTAPMLKLLFRMCRMAKKRNRHGGARNNSACRALEYPQDVPPGHDDADDVAIQQTLARSKAEHDAGSQHYRNMLKDLNAYMLQTAGRKAIDVPADGHCQAHALLEALREHDAQGVWTAVSLRNDQIDYMLANHAEYEDFAVDAENGVKVRRSSSNSFSEVGSCAQVLEANS